MIIFNFWAIPVGLVILMVLTGLSHFFPDMLYGEDLHPTRNHIVIGLVIAVVGAVGERVGAKGRVFFIPIWCIGLIIFGITIGWIGIAGLVAALVVLCIVTSARGKRREAGEWETAKTAATAAPAADSMSELEFWNWVQKALYLPRWTDLTTEMAGHNVVVLETISRSPQLRSPEDASPFLGLTVEMGRVVASGKDRTRLDPKLRAEAVRTIEAKMKGADNKSAGPPPLTTPPEVGDEMPPRLGRS